MNIHTVSYTTYDPNKPVIQQLEDHNEDMGFIGKYKSIVVGQEKVRVIVTTQLNLNFTSRREPIITSNLYTIYLDESQCILTDETNVERVIQNIFKNGFQQAKRKKEEEEKLSVE